MGPGRFSCAANLPNVSDLQGFNIPRGHIAKFNANGTLDTTWAPTGATDGPINALDVEDNGKILIGGAFTAYNTTPRNGVARLNANGSLDTSFDPGSGAIGGPVYLVNWDAIWARPSSAAHSPRTMAPAHRDSPASWPDQSGDLVR